MGNQNEMDFGGLDLVVNSIKTGATEPGQSGAVIASGITALTDNTAGTANNTLEALADGTTYANDVAAIRNNFADLAAKVNEIITALS